MRLFDTAAKRDYYVKNRQEALVSEEVFNYIEANKSEFIRCKDFDSLINEYLSEKLELKEINTILEFISRQYGNWFARWVFSPLSSPDLRAFTETEHWETLRQVFAKPVNESHPEIAELMVARHEQLKGACILKARIDLYKGNSYERRKASLVSRSAIVLNWLGFAKLAKDMYSAALFPKGTVGRGES